ncbi:flagellar basal body P-ring formation protein FlgA [Aliishimia ponticola]|uniref:Flagella basal body P-ring formation protein FlgA n=1 Tax=Aliishimia ponticola TaxID=2499833 RepID=A0A4S4NBF3_9RHOB|nr:flagellar basal body P-ring formation chaperone FlgA [Aliishimia ponticola]THH35311.1 flagellar basal body P-ring formation protein FlgA [Aliishimia ponticola]
MKWALAALLVLVASLSQAEAIVAIKTIRPNTVLTEADLAVNPNLRNVGLSDFAQVVGMETKVVLYPGRAIRPADIRPPALVNRNQIVPLVFNQAGLSISTAGRALDRGAVGEMIRVMNLSSRSTLFGTVLPDGSIDVSGP